MMSRYKQPKKLHALAMSRLGDWVALLAEKQMAPLTLMAKRDVAGAQQKLGEFIRSVKQYLEYNLPWMLYDFLAMQCIRTLTELLEKLKQAQSFRLSMAKFVSETNVIVSTIEVVFTKYISTLSIDEIPKIMRTTFYSKLHLLTGLVYLNLGSLSGGWKTSDMENAIIQPLKQLHRLKYLVINYDCTDNILRCLVENCKLLEKLDVSSSKCIDNNSLDIIAKLDNLRAVQLYRTSITIEGFANVLLKCKKLQDIGRCDEIGKVLEFIDLTNSDIRPLKLTSYVSRYSTPHQLQLVVDMCPCIRRLTVFHHTVRAVKSDLMILIGLSELCDFKLLSCDFYADQVKQVLQVKGCNIRRLHLEHVDQIDLNALMYISQMCPLLEEFTLYNCTLIQHTSLYTNKLEMLPYRNLKKFTCVSTCSDEQLMFVLGNALNVELVHLGTAVQLTDEFVMKLLDANPLIYLKELRVMQSDCLTIVSIERLIESCMSLEVLVEFESWSLLTDTDRDYLRNYIKINNFNINTEPLRRYDV